MKYLVGCLPTKIAFFKQYVSVFCGTINLIVRMRYLTPVIEPTNGGPISRHFVVWLMLRIRQ
jgi:hypothetical protein